jgi:hypothetical protein
MKELLWIIAAAIGLFIIWLTTGGPERIENKGRPFLEQPAPIESYNPYTLEELRDRTRP